VSEVVVVYAGESPPDEGWDASLFLAGPMPRKTAVPSWRPDALQAIWAAWTQPGRLVVFAPEARDGRPFSYDHHSWEDRWLSIVDVITFWVPRDMQRLPGLNTNIEFGRWEGSGRYVFGAPADAVHVGYLRECAQRQEAPVALTLEETIGQALELIGEGARREGGQRDVPLLLWRVPEFQKWLAAQATPFRGGRVLWVHDFHDGLPRYWAFSAQLEEGSEVVIGRS
jgi:hypothetical protein